MSRTAVAGRPPSSPSRNGSRSPSRGGDRAAVRDIQQSTAARSPMNKQELEDAYAQQKRQERTKRPESAKVSSPLANSSHDPISLMRMVRASRVDDKITRPDDDASSSGYDKSGGKGSSKSPAASPAHTAAKMKDALAKGDIHSALQHAKSVVQTKTPHSRRKTEEANSKAVIADARGRASAGIARTDDVDPEVAQRALGRRVSSSRASSHQDRDDDRLRPSSSSKSPGRNNSASSSKPSGHSKSPGRNASNIRAKSPGRNAAGRSEEAPQQQPEKDKGKATGAKSPARRGNTRPNSSRDDRPPSGDKVARPSSPERVNQPNPPTAVPAKSALSKKSSSPTNSDKSSNSGSPKHQQQQELQKQASEDDLLETASNASMGSKASTSTSPSNKDPVSAFKRMFGKRSDSRASNGSSVSNNTNNNNSSSSSKQAAHSRSSSEVPRSPSHGGGSSEVPSRSNSRMSNASESGASAASGGAPGPLLRVRRDDGLGVPGRYSAVYDLPMLKKTGSNDSIKKSPSNEGLLKKSPSGEPGPEAKKKPLSPQNGEQGKIEMFGALRVKSSLSTAADAAFTPIHYNNAMSILTDMFCTLDKDTILRELERAEGHMEKAVELLLAKSYSSKSAHDPNKPPAHQGFGLWAIKKSESMKHLSSLIKSNDKKLIDAMLAEEKYQDKPALDVNVIDPEINSTRAELNSPTHQSRKIASISHMVRDGGKPAATGAARPASPQKLRQQPQQQQKQKAQKRDDEDSDEHSDDDDDDSSPTTTLANRLVGGKVIQNVARKQKASTLTRNAASVLDAKKREKARQRARQTAAKYGTLPKSGSNSKKLEVKVEDDDEENIVVDAEPEPVPEPRKLTPEEEQAEARRIKERDNMLREIVTSEQSYVDHLNALLRIYWDALSDKDTQHALNINSTHLERLFSNVVLIAEEHKCFLKRLQDAKEDTRKLLEVFVNNTSFLNIYTEYVGKFYAQCLTTIETLMENVKFQSFLRKLTENKDSRGLTLTSYLIMPVQRIPRYEMLLCGIKRLTPQDHADYALLEKACDKINAVATHVNANVVLATSRPLETSMLNETTPQSPEGREGM